MSFSVVLRVVLTIVVASVVFSGMLRSVVAMSFNDESILSALASMISRPARIKSKKLFSVVGSALNGCSVVDSVASTFAVLSSVGSSLPKSSEKKSIESLSSSASSSSLWRICRLTCRTTFKERLQS